MAANLVFTVPADVAVVQLDEQTRFRAAEAWEWVKENSELQKYKWRGSPQGEEMTVEEVGCGFRVCGPRLRTLIADLKRGCEYAAGRVPSQSRSIRTQIWYICARRVSVEMGRKGG
jgi:hypothetical protein